MQDIISTENLTKHFGAVHAVESVSINVGKGEIYGFLGLNGAGKTTTIRMLLGMIRPTSGTASLFGEKVSADRCDLWKKVGYLVETPFAYPELTVRENLEIIRRLRQIPDRDSVDAVMDKLRLTPYKDRKSSHLSLGNTQRLGLAKALIHNPDLLILDEPANGLDPVGIVEIRELFMDLSANHGITIFISSHILGEISRFATRIGIIHEGHLVQEINTDKLESLLEKKLLVNARDRYAAQVFLAGAGYPASATKDGPLEITGEKGTENPDAVATALVNAGLPPTLLHVEEEDLESYFLRIIGVNKPMDDGIVDSNITDGKIGTTEPGTHRIGVDGK